MTRESARSSVRWTCSRCRTRVHSPARPKTWTWLPVSQVLVCATCSGRPPKGKAQAGTEAGR